MHEAAAELRRITDSLRGLREEGPTEEAGHREQPRPRLPLLSEGKDPTLAERFEDELHGS